MSTRTFSAFALLLILSLSELRGQANDNPTGPTGMFNGNVATGCSYDPYTGNATRSVTDIVVAGAVGRYPLAFGRTSNSRGFTGGSYQFGIPGGWRHSYTWTLGSESTTSSTAPPTSYTAGFPDGRTAGFYGSSGIIRASARGVPERLVPLNQNTMLAYLILADGGKIEFKATKQQYTEPPDPGSEPGVGNNGTVYYVYTYEAQAIFDPYGLKTTLTYNNDRSLYQITEPAGRWIRLFYGSTIDGPVISRIQASDQRQVVYHYGQAYCPPGNRTYAYLGLVTYYADSSIGTAAYTYKAPNVPDYTGKYNGFPLLSTAYDPMYAGAMTKIAYDYKPNASGVVAGQLLREKYVDETVVSIVGVTNATTRTETRGDGPSRSFTYASGKLTSWTDFNGKGMSQTYDGNGYVNSFTDANGNKTDMVRESVTGRITTLTHPADDNNVRYSVTYTYTDPANPYYLASVKNERNFTTTFTRDANRRVWRIDYPDTGYETFTYNGFGQVLNHRMTSGGTETFGYDARGLKTAYRDPYHQSGNPTARYLYDSLDRLWKVTDSLGTTAGDPAHTTVYTYNTRGQVTRITHPDGTYIQYGYDILGNRTWVIDELNHATTYTYDWYRRVLTVKNALNQISANSYIPHGKTSSYLTTSDFVYKAEAPSGKEVWNYAHPNLWRSRLCQGPYTADQADTYFTYDNVGNLLSVKDPREYITSYDYDRRNRRTSMTNPYTQITRWEYDAAGNITKETRPDTKFRRWDLYDTMNRVKHTFGFMNEPTSYTYDLAGNLTRLTDSKGANYDFGYDLMNRKWSASYPPDYYYETVRSETWSYDTRGNLYQYKTPSNWTKTFTYDNRNRLTNAEWDTTYGQSIGVTTAYDAASRVTSVVSGVTTIAFGYDNANRQIWEDQTLSGQPTRRVNTPVDIDGNRDSLSVTTAGASNYAINYDYTQRQQLWHINNANNYQWFEFTHDKSGNVTKRQNKLQGLDSTNFSYDKLNRIEICEQTAANDVVFARSHYGYDSVGNLQYTHRYEQGDKGERFTYDADNQLKSVLYNANAPWTTTPTGYDRSVSYTYGGDRLNRTSMNDNGAMTYYTPNGLNQYTAVTGEAPVYNGNFHLYSFDGWTYMYDADARLTSATAAGHSAAFVYDGLGRCLKRTIDGMVTHITYDGWKPIVEWDSAGNRIAFNIYGPGADEILTRYQVGVGYTHYKSDRLGNVQFLLSETNGGIEKYTYDAFGKPKITDWAGNVRTDSAYGNRFMFTGREFLTTLGIYDYRRRHYHPGLGRFLQTDPIGFGGGDNNLYRYCGNNPANRRDPLGLSGILTIYANDGNVLIPGHTGHNWISYTSDQTGLTAFYATYPDGMHHNDGYSADVIRQTWINDGAEAGLFEHIKYMEGLGPKAWTPYANCTLFATFAWAIATGESLRYLNDAAIGSPSRVVDSIRQLNGDHDYAFRFTDGSNGYYFGASGFGRYDRNGNGYYIWDPNGAPGAQIGQTTDGQPIYQGGGGGGGGGSGSGGSGGISGFGIFATLPGGTRVEIIKFY